MKSHYIIAWLCAGSILGSSLSVQAQNLKNERATDEVKNIVSVIQLMVHQGQSAEAVKVSFKSLDEILKDKNGIPMLKVTGSLPVINDMQSEKAIKKINTFYNNKLKEFNKLKGSDFEIAQNDYALKSQEEKAYWQGYELGMSYTTKRNDGTVISFVEDDYEYMGGAHPNSVRYAQNFDRKTGKQLKFKDIVTDEAAARAAINKDILETLQGAEYKDYLFEDYKAHIDEILQENTWYLSEEGLVIIANEYIITPHAVGIIEFNMPYESFPYLKAEYKI